jgi:uncharacterized protein YjbI with pentapeptide repeats
MKPFTLALVASSVLVAGCTFGEAEDIDLGATEDDIISQNGISLNGISLNGISLNGISLNGISLNGISLNGISLNGVTLTGTSVTNTLISGVRNGTTLSGAGMVGSVMTANTSTGSQVSVRIDGAYKLTGANADVWVYNMKYETTTGWVALCAGSNEAMAFPGTWNYGTTRHQWDANLFTLACRGATFAKCYELGYKGDSKLDTYHQTCIRAHRADYCGDGVSYTVDGIQINIFDNLGLQADTQAWRVEANWTPDGAVCVDAVRKTFTAPECVRTRLNLTCSTSSWGTAIIRTELK